MTKARDIRVLAKLRALSWATGQFIMSDQSNSADTLRRENTQPPTLSTPVPVHSAESLTEGGPTAHICLMGQTYVLRITRTGKLILTK